MWFNKKSNDDRIDEAIRLRESINLPHLQKLAPREVEEAGNTLADIRFRNIKLQLADAPSIGTVVRVRLIGSAATGEPVYELHTVDGRTYSLWCGSDGSVRSISRD